MRTMPRSWTSRKRRATHLAQLYDPQCTTKKDTLGSIRSIVRLKLHEMQDSWLSARADEIQGYADKNDMKNFDSSLKEVYGPTSPGSSPLLRAEAHIREQNPGEEAHIREQNPGEVG